MRPISVRFQCFGPYMQEQFIDFEELEKNGLFLICGETGAGKTTILDAICYALYGRSSGGLRGGLEVMRCALAGDEDDTFVEYIFETGGRRYRFTRSLKFKTGKNKKSRNLNDYHNCMELTGDGQLPLVEKEQDKYVSKKAEELIGLTYDQFRQVIILPQGQFERLLVSPSEEKETILVSLFHAQRWQRIAEELQRRVAEEDKALKDERRSIEEKLRLFDCRDLSQLEQKRDVQRQQLEELLTRTQEAETVLAEAKQHKERCLLEDQAFGELTRREKRLAALDARAPAFEREAMLLADADRAEQIREPYTLWQNARAGEDRAKNSVDASALSLEQKERALAHVREKQRQRETAAGEMEEKRQLILQLANARDVYGMLTRRETEAAQADRQETAARQMARQADSAFVLRDQELKEAMARQQRAMEDYQHLQQAYLAGIGGVLARELKPGQPCPVCGSREHPSPAEAGQQQVTDARLNQAMEQMNKEGRLVTQTMDLRRQAEQKKQQADEAYAQARRNRDLAAAAWQEAQSQRLPGIETEAQRAARQQLLEREVLAYEEAGRTLQQQLTTAMAGEAAARELLTAAQEALSGARQTARDAMTAWEIALESSGLGTVQRYLAADLAAGEKQRRKTALHQFLAEREAAQADVAAQRELLADKTAPDVAGAEKQLMDAENRHRSCVTAQTLAAKALEDMGREAESLARRLQTYEAARLRVDGDLVYARRLRGDNGISLQRYVLGVMLTSVTAEANRLLSGVYGGRYRLYRTDEISGRSRKGGLELEVQDNQTGQRRSVTTLSGGEKFLVALSLAIGLSTVVQAQGGGIRLEAMFVDEGFGSLDREAVGDALEVLQGIRKGSGIVGIISHVEQLTEVIPTRLEITKGRNGSRCTLRN